jgi:hypothetical protein
MATLGTYYFDGASFIDSTTLYTDSALSNIAPDGWYNIGGIYRKLQGGVLQSVINCPACDIGCSYPVGPTYQTTSETAGNYNHTIDVGSATGAIIVEVNVWGSNVGFTWTYDGVSASEYTNPTYGYLQGVIGEENPSTGDCSALPLTNALGSNGQTLAGNEFTFNIGTGDYIVGPAVTLGPISNQAAGGVSLTTNPPGESYMVIPKPNASPSTIDIQALVTCAHADFTIIASCPITLLPFDGSASAADCTAACALSYTTQYYNAPASSNPTPNLGIPSQYDWVFLDENGVTEVPNGTYKVSVNGVPNCMVVADGIITSLTPC